MHLERICRSIRGSRVIGGRLGSAQFVSNRSIQYSTMTTRHRDSRSETVCMPEARLPPSRDGKNTYGLHVLLRSKVVRSRMGAYSWKDSVPSGGCSGAFRLGRIVFPAASIMCMQCNAAGLSFSVNPTYALYSSSGEKSNIRWHANRTILCH